MSAIKRMLIMVLIALAMLSVAGCADQSARDQAQDKYDQLVIETNSQIAVVQNVSDQQNRYAMTEPMMKSWLGEYRSQVAVLQNDVNATNDAGSQLKTYLSPGTSDYATMTTNEETLRQHLELFVGDYNRNAEGYNSHWGIGNGTVPLL